MIDFDALRAAITRAAVLAVNDELEKGVDRAKHDAPVRKVFRGGRQTVRFKTADEIGRDKTIRANLGLGPERLATPEAIERVRAAGLNPIRSITSRSSRAPRGLVGEEGFARTIEFPSRARSVDRTGRTPAQRGITRNARDRQNAYRPPFAAEGGPNPRVVNASQGGRVYTPHGLADENVERQLSGRGRYELKSGRAFHQRQKTVTVRKAAILNARSGEVQGYDTESFTVGVGPTTLGGALRDSIRMIPASAGQYPNIEGWVVAGGGEVDYAKYQELGTRHNPAHPFLRPRLPEWRQSLPDALRRSFGRTVAYRVVRG